MTRISMHVTSGCNMGLRIFSNGTHCRTVMSLDDVSLRSYKLRIPFNLQAGEENRKRQCESNIYEAAERLTNRKPEIEQEEGHLDDGVCTIDHDFFNK